MLGIIHILGHSLLPPTPQHIPHPGNAPPREREREIRAGGTGACGGAPRRGDAVVGMEELSANLVIFSAVGFSASSYDPAFGQNPDASVKAKIINLIASVRTLMRSTHAILSSRIKTGFKADFFAICSTPDCNQHIHHSI